MTPDSILEITRGNILDVPAEALLLPIDGAKAGLEGNISRQYSQRWPQEWADIARALRYPIPHGRTVGLAWEGDAPWRLYLFPSILHHDDILDDSQKMNVVSRAFTEAIQLCVKHRVKSMSTPILRGGWRLSQDDALAAMRTPVAHALAARSQLKIQICCL